MTTTENTQAASTDSATDPRPVLDQALDQMGRLITETDPSIAASPTPCSEYDVAALVAHLQAVVLRIGAVVRGEPFWSVPREVASTDWAEDWAAGRRATDTALAAADLDRLVTVPWGEVPLRGAVGSYVSELATHAWDLAVATGRVDRLDPLLAEAALTAAKAKIPAEPRGDDIPFGPVVEVGPDATAYEQLVAWCGRDPRWTP